MSDREEVTDSATDGDGCGLLQDLITSLEESLEETRLSGNLNTEEGKQKENFWKDKSQKEAESPKLQKSSNSGEVYFLQLSSCVVIFVVVCFYKLLIIRT